MAVDIKNTQGPDQFSALGMLRSLTETTPSSAAISPVTAPVTFAGAQVPAPNLRGNDTDLAGKFVSTSQTSASSPSTENRPEEGMDIMTFYMLMRGEAQDLTQTSDEDFADNFNKFINAISNVPGFENLRNQEVTFGGRTMTLGELTTGFAEHGIGMAAFAGARFAPGNRMSDEAINRVSSRAPTEVRNAIERACALTGADRGAMFAFAKQESGFRPKIVSQTGGSATGLFQITNDAETEVFRLHGDFLRANGISPGMRTDAFANAVMAGLLYRDHKRDLERDLGRPVSAGEIYMAHFLGQGGARTFFRQLERNPNAMADEIFPRAAIHNPIMHNRTLAQLGQTMMAKVGVNFELS